jgi:hypothetical protein
MPGSTLRSSSHDDAGPDGAGDSIDLRSPTIELRLSPLFADPSPDRGTPVARPDRPVSDQPRRQALLAEFRQAGQQPALPSSPSPQAAPSLAPPANRSIADALRELNELRVNETIDEQEFKARKAELFASRSTAPGPAPRDATAR